MGKKGFKDLELIRKLLTPLYERGVRGDLRPKF
jgi:hypothetical protein